MEMGVAEEALNRKKNALPGCKLENNAEALATPLNVYEVPESNVAVMTAVGTAL